MKPFPLLRFWPFTRKKRSSLPVRLIGWTVGVAIAIQAVLALALISLKWVDPPTTGVQMQRRVESWFGDKKYEKRRTPVPLGAISMQLRHAVIAAEDGRFYDHDGFDWLEVEKVLDDSREKGRMTRGASTITQQLVKNLFFTTHRNPLRKAYEFTLVPIAEQFLAKDRILEIYLNNAEWGTAVFGVEAAARYHYQVAAKDLSREQAARLAACLPDPRRRRPSRMDTYSGIILTRMEARGW
jgi:monofunctional biosynthetic peptidoglycan transglycosylase